MSVALHKLILLVVAVWALLTLAVSAALVYNSSIPSAGATVAFGVLTLLFSLAWWVELHG